MEKGRGGNLNKGCYLGIYAGNHCSRIHANNNLITVALNFLGGIGVSLGLNIFLIEVHPGVYRCVLKASDSTFDCPPEFIVTISKFSAVFGNSVEQHIRVR